MIETKLDIINAISIVSRFVQNSNSNYIKVVKRIIVYLNITFEKDIVYNIEKHKLKLQKYYNVNWTNDKVSKKFIDVYIFLLNEKSIN